MGGVLWIIIVGFVAGMIARWLSPGPNDPKGFILTIVLGIAGAFLATFMGQAIRHARCAGGAVHLEPAGHAWRDLGPRQQGLRERGCLT